LRDPLLEGGGGLFDHPVFGLAAAGGLNPEIVFFVGPIQAKGGREVCCSLVLIPSLMGWLG
jgi:hypothetical protein